MCLNSWILHFSKPRRQWSGIDGSLADPDISFCTPALLDHHTANCMCHSTCKNPDLDVPETLMNSQLSQSPHFCHDLQWASSLWPPIWKEVLHCTSSPPCYHTQHPEVSTATSLELIWPFRVEFILIIWVTNYILHKLYLFIIHLHAAVLILGQWL